MAEQQRRYVTHEDCAALHSEVHQSIREMKATLGIVRDDVVEGRKDILGVKEEVRALKEHQVAQNGKVNDIQLEMARADGVAGERVKWEERQAALFRWILGISLVFAGVISGIVFGILTLVVE